MTITRTILAHTLAAVAFIVVDVALIYAGCSLLFALLLASSAAGGVASMVQSFER